MVWSCCLKEQLKKSEKIFKLIKCFFSDLLDFDYTGGQAKNNEGESGDDEEIDINEEESGDDEKITMERVVRVERVVTESNEGESGDDEEIDIKLEEENAANENNENVIEQCLI